MEDGCIFKAKIDCGYRSYGAICHGEYYLDLGCTRLELETPLGRGAGDGPMIFNGWRHFSRAPIMGARLLLLPHWRWAFDLEGTAPPPKSLGPVVQNSPCQEQVTYLEDRCCPISFFLVLLGAHGGSPKWHQPPSSGSSGSLGLVPPR